MRKFNIFVSISLVLISGIVFLSGCTPEKSTKLTVVTSTSLMEYVVQQVGGDHVEVINMVPPNQHPGNFDAKPGDIQKLASADLFLLHGWPGEGYADKLIASANNTKLNVIKVNVNGNWMIPSVQSAAVDKVAEVLSGIDSKNVSDYQKNAKAYKERITAKETAIKSQLTNANVSEVNVIASVRQADFLQWAGFNVAATFMNAQSLTPQTVQELIDTGRTEGVSLVVNNLQDGADAGKSVAQDLNVANVNISNFPGGFENTASWEKAVDYNVNTLLNAVATAK